jgi:hypothetical protein
MLDCYSTLRYNRVMISPEEEKYVLARAYVPEHILNLMVSVSKGEPFLVEEYLYFAHDNWLIFVGYPLERDFSKARCEAAVEQAVDTIRPEYLWFIGPEIPDGWSDSCAERQSDRYYKLDLALTHPKPSLLRQAEHAAQEARVEIARKFTRQHAALIAEFLKRENLPPMIRELYRAMPYYVTSSPTAALLAAHDKKERLTALFVVELNAREFATYVLGCYSRTHYVAHASDLLFREMIELAKKEGKNYINLGLGVNAGIKRFKEKWGGVPFLAYEFCERRFQRKKRAPLFRLLEGKL